MPRGHNSKPKIQAQKLSLYSDTTALIISDSKTKATGILHSHPEEDNNGNTPQQTLRYQLDGKIVIQRQHISYLVPQDPFLNLGVELSMDLNWKYQIQRTTSNLKKKLEAHNASYASPRQTLNTIRTAIIPSLA